MGWLSVAGETLLKLAQNDLKMQTYKTDQKYERSGSTRQSTSLTKGMLFTGNALIWDQFCHQVQDISFATRYQESGQDRNMLGAVWESEVLRQHNFNFVKSTSSSTSSTQIQTCLAQSKGGKKAGIQRLKFRCLFTRFCALTLFLNMVSNHEK